MSEQVAGGPFQPAQVARGRTYRSGWARAATAGACGLAALGGLAWIVWPSAPREPAPAAAANAGWNMGRSLPERPIRQTVSMPAVVVAPPPKAATPAAAPVVAAPPERHAMGFWEDSGAIQQAAQRVTGRSGTTSPGSTGLDASGVASPAPPTSDYAQRMQTTEFGDTTPVPPRFHQQFTIAEGTSFPCTVREPVSSALPGDIQCKSDQDVWSMDGNTILLPVGTKVNGRIERGLVNGEDRQFIIWRRAETPGPDRAVIPLFSPAADELGQTGAPGDVNTHFSRRFGNALAYSLLDIASSAVGAAASGSGNTNINLGSVGSQAQSLGAMQFQRDANIPPTLFRAQGQTMTVKINKYIDLVNYFQLRVAR